MSRYSQFTLVTPLEPDLACYLRGSIYPRNSHEMLPSWTHQQARKFRKLVIVFFYIGLLTCPTSAFPSNKVKTRVIQHKDKISVKTTGCRPLTLEELRTRMGTAFDETKMAYDDDSMKRSPSKSSVINKETGDKVGNLLNDEEELEDITGSSDKGGTVRVQSRMFMRRKRDATLTGDGDNKNIISDNSFLYQNLLFDSISRRKSRKRRSSGKHQFHPAWECKKTTYWKKLNDGYFPKRILDGECKQKSCFFGMYTCNPVKYAIKVLKRDPSDACKPVPLIGQNTTYEESWVFKRIHVTVACECGQSWKAAKRKRHRGESRETGE